MALLSVVTIGAAYVPARRAAVLDPVEGSKPTERFRLRCSGGGGVRPGSDPEPQGSDPGL